jgi:hypothetical protein
MANQVGITDNTKIMVERELKNSGYEFSRLLKVEVELGWTEKYNFIEQFTYRGIVFIIMVSPTDTKLQERVVSIEKECFKLITDEEICINN